MHGRITAPVHFLISDLKNKIVICIINHYICISDLNQNTKNILIMKHRKLREAYLIISGCLFFVCICVTSPLVALAGVLNLTTAVALNPEVLKP